jgi:Cdc6-like AAA superfamily ATPase
MKAVAEQRSLFDIDIEAGRVFTPTAPIDERSLFAGRTQQLRQILDAVHQKGQHAIVFGERGVGKTSLANVLRTFLSIPTGESILTPRYNCSGVDTLESIWRNMLADIQMSVPGVGFEAQPRPQPYNFADLLPEQLSPDAIRRSVGTLAKSVVPIFIIDEFDRLPKDVRRAFADIIKSLSDHAVPATMILVGVADSVDQLIEEHQSIERALVQVHMPRMSAGEIAEIVDKGLARLGLEIEQDARERIVLLSQGLPHYTHLIALHAVREAIDGGQRIVTVDTVNGSIIKAMGGVQQSIRSAWNRAISSPRKDNLFSEVLLACALAKTDELGYFAAQDVRGPIRAITGRPYDIPSFAQHLNEFADEKRGSILQKTGRKRHYRYRFTNPLMQPFVVMQGFARGRLTDEMLLQLGRLRDS